MYEILGFGLGKLYPDAAFLSDAPPVVTDAKVQEIAQLLASDQPLVGLSPEIELLLEAAISKLLKWGLSKLGL